MPKRICPQPVKKHLSYTMLDAAEILDVHITTVRGWVKRGLPIIKDQRPFLIIGAHLIAYLEETNEKRSFRLRKNQLTCLSCKKGVLPDGMLADFTHAKNLLSGLCPHCGTVCNRFAAYKSLPAIAPDLDILERDKTPARSNPVALPRSDNVVRFSSREHAQRTISGHCATDSIHEPKRTHDHRLKDSL